MGGSSRLDLSGQATVVSAAQIAERAREVLASGAPIVVDISSLERADVAVVQLLIALARSAHAAGVGFTVEGDLKPLTAAVAGAVDLPALLGMA